MTFPPTGGEVIHAAGGLLWRTVEGRRELLLIHRTRYGPEWALPKGKLDPGEGWTAAALREVEEETGCQARLGDFAGGNVYRVDGTPKVVLYWHMDLVSEGAIGDVREVAEKRWTTVEEARRILTHASERDLLPPPV